MSTGALPLNPLRSFEPLSSLIMDLASVVVIGNIRNATSFITSVIIPPRPTMRIGPNWESFWIPTISSTPFGTIFSSKIPLTLTPLFLASLPYMSLNVFLTSLRLSNPTLTPPTSVLCKICGDTTFITRGKPILFACFAASLAEVTSANDGTLTP